MLQASADRADRADRVDLEALYATHAQPLRRIVSRSVDVSEPLVEDACQVAWSRLILRLGAVRREAVLSWLVTTASREAVKLSRRADRDVSLQELADEGHDPSQLTRWTPPADEVAELRARLRQVQELPRRQQQLVWLHGFGLSYEEMAAYTGASRRTVERQLLRAKRTLRAA